MSRSMLVLLLVLFGLGIAIGIAWGWQALAVYAFFAAIVAAVGVGTWVGGDWLHDVSAGRFHRRRD